MLQDLKTSTQDSQSAANEGETDSRSSSLSSNHFGKRKKMKKATEPNEVTNALNRLENISSVINTNRNREDEFHFFGMNVACQLRQLPLYEAVGVQSEIQQILTAARRRTMYTNVFPVSNQQTDPASGTTYETLSSERSSSPAASHTQHSTHGGTDMLTEAWNLS